MVLVQGKTSKRSCCSLLAFWLSFLWTNNRARKRTTCYWLSLICQSRSSQSESKSGFSSHFLRSAWFTFIMPCWSYLTCDFEMILSRLLILKRAFDLPKSSPSYTSTRRIQSSHRFPYEHHVTLNSWHGNVNSFFLKDKIPGIETALPLKN